MNFKHKTKSHLFTTKADGIARVLGMDIEITQIDSPGKRYKTKGIWDTGATSTVITEEVFKHLDLKEFGRTTVNTATLTGVPKPTYLIDVFLKPDLRVQAVEVTVGTIDTQRGIDCLIGMDIISLGDFSITNYQGKTCFSFRIPSQHEIDYVKTAQAGEAMIKRHFDAKRTMNNLCICNSGKKFKNCHGSDLIEG